MKKLVLASVLFTCCIPALQAAAVINLFAGQLRDENGVAIQNGDLIQIVVSTGDSSFADPSGLSFVGSSADDVVAFSFAFNRATTNTDGADNRPISLNYETPTNGKQIGPGMPILLRWFPTRDTLASSPSAGDPYGEFRTAAIVDGSTIGFVTPDNGATATLNFATQSIGGSQPNSAGVASKIVPVPEPATASLLAFGLLAAFGRPRRA